MHINTDALFGLIWILFYFLIVFLIIRAIWRAIKRFIFEIIDHANGTTPKANAGKKYTYTYEARKACDDVTPKRKQNTTPPWEE